MRDNQESNNESDRSDEANVTVGHTEPSNSIKSDYPYCSGSFNDGDDDEPVHNFDDVGNSNDVSGQKL